MLPKSAHLGPQHASQFKDGSVVEAYRHRPPYPKEVFRVLSELINEPRVVLDAGCGMGSIARGIVGFVDRVDAVDFSPGMIEEGKRLPGGDSHKLNWIEGRMEEVRLQPPYGLVTAGASLHWMDWDVVLPRFEEVRTPKGYLAIVDDETLPTSWDGGLRRAVARFSTNREYQAYDLVGELTMRGLFSKRGERRTAPTTFTQPVDGYIESFHARNGFSRERMSEEAAAAFDAEVRRLVLPFCKNGIVELEVVATVVWGRPGRER